MSSITGDAAFDAWIYKAARDELRRRSCSGGDGLLTTKKAVMRVIQSPKFLDQILLKYISTRFDGELGKEFVARFRASPAEKTLKKWLLDAERKKRNGKYGRILQT